jgi:TonB family protein
MKAFRKAPLLAAAVAAIVLPAGVWAQDFSDSRFREGRDAYRARRFEDAIGLFRVAGFGFLDRPARLCETLVYLALAADAAGRQRESQTFLARLADAERLAPACAEADIDRATRSEFESRFRRRAPRVDSVAATSGASEPAPAFSGSGSSPPPPAESAAQPPPRTDRTAPAGTERLSAAESASAAPPASDPPEAATPARLRTAVHAVYPSVARAARIGGIVVLRVLVSERGEPLQVEVVQGVRPDLNSAAITAIKNCVFEPARVNGREVRASTTVSVSFRP